MKKPIHTDYVKVKFMNLLRSRHNVESLYVTPGTIESIIEEICTQVPDITEKELEDAVMFINRQKVMHLNRKKEIVNAGDEIVFTNFVGGG